MVNEELSPKGFSGSIAGDCPPGATPIAQTSFLVVLLIEGGILVVLELSQSAAFFSGECWYV
jgi:hypothetical protein